MAFIDVINSTGAAIEKLFQDASAAVTPPAAPAVTTQTIDNTAATAPATDGNLPVPFALILGAGALFLLYRSMKHA